MIGLIFGETDFPKYIHKKLKKKKNIFTIGLGYTFQKIKKVPINKYDIKLDHIVTEKQK